MVVVVVEHGGAQVLVEGFVTRVGGVLGYGQDNAAWLRMLLAYDGWYLPQRTASSPASLYLRTAATG